ncbi:MAG: glycosyltransferase [Hyphomonadaceae bacterium]
MSELPKISVVICAYNPREDYLSRVLASLRDQTLDRTRFEIVLVDNASTAALVTRFDLSWHPGARHVREEKLGLTNARLRGISECGAELIVFVDDDNVLASDYLEQVLSISRDFPFLGVWGGSIEPEFESAPPKWVFSHLEKLAVRPTSQDRWSNAHDDWRSTPVGAGMCVRMRVAQEYVRRTASSGVGIALGRKGDDGLAAGDDSSISLTALELGSGQGVFARLRLTHLIPASRLQEAYLLRITEGTHSSGVIVEHLHGLPSAPTQPKLAFALSCVSTFLKEGPRAVRFRISMRRGRSKMLRKLAKRDHVHTI